jgi:hypothetical protein
MGSTSIYDIFEIPNKGVVIGGINPEFDNMLLDEIQRIIGDFIEIHNPDGSVLHSAVEGIEITNSLINKKNIYILLQRDLTAGILLKEAVVYSTENIMTP